MTQVTVHCYADGCVEVEIGDETFSFGTGTLNWEDMPVGWSTGSIIMQRIVEEAKSAIPDKKVRLAFYKHVIHAFQMEDCDTLDECVGADSIFDKALKAME
jgi:hypothetical protein